jgi:hypothetical protein
MFPYCVSICFHNPQRFQGYKPPWIPIGPCPTTPALPATWWRGDILAAKMAGCCLLTSADPWRVDTTHIFALGKRLKSPRLWTWRPNTLKIMDWEEIDLPSGALYSGNSNLWSII